MRPRGLDSVSDGHNEPQVLVLYVPYSLYIVCSYRYMCMEVCIHSSDSFSLPLCRDGLYSCDAVGGKPSLSHFRKVWYCPLTDTSLVECRPYTGRTHQLRLVTKHIVCMYVSMYVCILILSCLLACLLSICSYVGIPSRTTPSMEETSSFSAKIRLGRLRRMPWRRFDPPSVL